MSNAEKLINMILKMGLKTYRYKNSNYITVDHADDSNKKGVIFGFRSKADMQCSKGFVMSSKEAVLDNLGYLTHWTPNVFAWGGYTDESKKYVRGFEEKNLIQENCFVLDIDCGAFSKLRIDYLLVKCMENTDLVPTAIVETPKGYHLYFVLDSASYVSSAGNYKSLSVAKMISQNLRESFARILPGVDVACNHFGIFRMPTEENLVHFDEKLTYDFEDLMNWSMAYSREQKKSFAFSMTPKKKQKEYKQRHAAWYKQLLQTADVQGGKGQIGRNNVLFTLALADYSSGVDQQDCFDQLDLYNTEVLANPVRTRELAKVVASAYSDKYQGAHSEKISALSELYLTNNGVKSSYKNSRVPVQYWVKHAKPREERERIHLKEWKADLINYINEHTTWYKPYLDVPREKLIKDLGIPSSTLKVLFRELKKESSVYIQTKRGKGGFTKLATKKSMAYTLLQKRYELFTHYKDVLGRYFPSSLTYTNTIANLRFVGSLASDNVNLFERAP